LSTTLAALSDPTRRAIVARLQVGPASVTELAEPFRMSQQAVSKHLAYLERARLVHKRRDGRKQICELTPEPIREVADWAEDYRRHWESAFRRLRGLLRRQADQTESRQKGER
jgi:DNA-binding transcriptional ArsR family regulator